jgi:hypothetical protein
MFLSCLFTIFAYTKATPDNKLILLLEIFITGFSTISYYFFTQKDFLQSITSIRYIEWTITTPLMLVVLCLILNISSIPLISAIIALDLIMLWFGYAGETNQIHPFAASIGFIPLFFIFYLLYINGKVNDIFSIYVLGWTGYGIAYYFNDYMKNTCMALLDAISKGVVAILLSKNALFPNSK